MEINGVEHYVADPQDVGNVLSYRDLLLAVTHDINEQKLAVIEALTDEHNGVGAEGPNGGLQATHMDIREYIDEYSNITTPSKSQLTGNGKQSNGILEQMEEDYLVEIHEGDGPHGAHMYEFLGGNTFGHPNLDIYGELFADVTDPIRDQPIAETVNDFKGQLSVKTAADLMDEDPTAAIGNVGGNSSTSSDTTSSDDESGTLSDFGDEDDTTDVEWDEIDTAVHERLQNTLDDLRATDEDVAALDMTHMLGISPTEMYMNDAELPFITAERPSDPDDKNGTIMDSSHRLYGDISDGQVESRIENSIAKLREHEVFEVYADDDNDCKCLVVHDLE
jgi:hypothetical protein